MNIIKLYNADSFRFNNSYTCKFNSYEESLKVCKKENFTAFVIYNSFVYYRNNKFEDLIINYIYHEKSILYILVPDMYSKFLISYKDRVNFYTKYIISNEHKLNSKDPYFYNINSLKDKIDSYPENKRNWSKQHHELLYKYLKLLNINTDKGFLINPYDIRHNTKKPCFVNLDPNTKRVLVFYCH